MFNSSVFVVKGGLEIPPGKYFSLSGADVNGISNNVTLSGNNQAALVTEYAVKHYVDESAEDIADSLKNELTSVDSYSETTYTNGMVSEINTWSTSSKSNLVRTKSFTYTNGLLTQVVERDGNNAVHLTKTITYDSDGNLESITKDYA